MFKFLKILQADSPSSPPQDAQDDALAAETIPGLESEWVQRRRPPLDRDRTLTSDTHVWLRRVPSGLHPKRTCRLFPRIANRLAREWHDPARTEALFNELLEDKRGGRAGFPPVVINEMIRLRTFHRRRRL